MTPQGNQWATITNMKVDYPVMDVSSWGDSYKTSVRGPGLVKFSGIAPATPQIMQAMMRWMDFDHPVFPIYAQEWMCLYCGSPNKLPETHCAKCGAPRNWLIG
jgi:hypothetical protein